MKRNNYIKSLLTLFLAVTTSVLLAVTAPVTVNITDSQGNAITAKYKVFKGPNYIGEFNAGAIAQLEVGDTYKIFAHYDKTSTARVTFVVPSSGKTFNYATTNVQFTWSGNYLDYRGSGDWNNFGKTNGVWNARELFPLDFYGNPLKIHFGKVWNDVRSQFLILNLTGQTTYHKTVSVLRLLDHNGNPLAGGTARGGYTTPTTWHVTGATDVNGYLLDVRNGTNSNLSYEMKYNNTISVVAQQVGSYYDFQTQQITMRLEKCDGTAVANGHTRWGHGTSFGTYHFAGGNTGANGESYLEFFPGTYSFEMSISGTTDSKISYNFPSDGSTVTFKTSTVTLNYAGVISFGGATGDTRYFKSYSSPSTGTMELMPGGTYKFHFRPGNRTDITIPACGTAPINYSAVILKVKDHSGNPLPGAHAIGQFGSGYSFHINGPNNVSDANGTIFYLGNGSGNMTVKMSYKGTSQTLTQNINTNSIFNFQTAQLKARLETCSGDPVNGGYVRYSNGQYKYWLNANVWGNSNTGNLAAGEVGGEVFPGTYDVDMQFRYGENTNTVVVTASGGMTTFKTTNVTATHTNTISYKSSIRPWTAWYTGPSMEFLPGDYTFFFTNAGSVNVTVGACTNPVFVSPSMVRLIDSDGDGLANGLVKYYKNGWQYLGTTDVNGNVSLAGKNLSGNVTFKMYWKGASITKVQNITNDGVVVFQTENVVAELKNSDNTASYAGLFKYYASGWKYLGTSTASTPASLELLPINYTFKVVYAGASINKQQNVGVDANVVFNTAPVTATLNNSDNTGSFAGVFKYYASGWKYFGTSTATMPAAKELLPRNYTFKVVYAGASINKQQNVGNNSDVVFNTAAVTAELNNSDNTADLPAVFKYYASGWKYFGTSTATMPAAKELLPRNYTFKAVYGGASNNKQQNVGVDNTVEFATVNVHATLADCDGNDLPAVFKYYASGWKYLGTSTSSTAASKELLPRNYTFKTVYGGTSKNMQQNVSVNTDVEFGATNVTINYSGMVKYYASGWKLFKNAGSASGTMAMLPRTYTFKFYSANGSTNQQITIGGCETNADFTAANLRLVDSDGNGLTGGTVKWWNGAWHNATGSTNNAGYLFLMTPTVHTSLQMWYRGHPVQYNNTNTMASPITWQTINVTGELLSSTGGALTSTLKFFALTWQNLDVANSTGTTFEGELLPGTYNFAFSYDGMYTGDQNLPVDISVNSHVTFSTVLAEFCATSTSFYSGFWHNNIGSSYEMIPGNYWFTFDGAPQYQVSVTNSGFYGCNTASKRDVTDDIATTEVKLGVYPNPFSDVATFSFELEETSVVKIVIYDLSGKVIKTVANGEFSQGSNQVQWNGTNDASAPAAAGVYFYRIEAGNSITTNRIILTR